MWAGQRDRLPMMRFFTRMFRWSWIVTLPFVVLGTFVAYKATDRYMNFTVRYDSAPFHLSLIASANYEIDAFVHEFKVGLSNFQHRGAFETVELFVPEANISKLNSHLPQSGFEYVKARMIIDDRLVKVKVKYRGDFFTALGLEQKILARQNRQGPPV